MRIATSSTGTNLDGEVDPRFGRCQYFVIADVETNEVESVDNTSAAAVGGAGISAAHMELNSLKDNGLPGRQDNSLYQDWYL